MADNVLLSICIPTYNRGEILSKSLNLLLPQIQDPSIEIIISNNNSQDNTKNIVENYQLKFKQIKYVENNVNIGLDKNVLRTINESSGKFVWLLSDDDILLEGTIDEIIINLMEHRLTGLYLHHEGFWEPDTYESVNENFNDFKDKIFTNPELLLNVHKLSHFSSIIIQRELLKNYTYILDEYENHGFVRGYSINMVHYAVLNSPDLHFKYIGKLCLAVRNPEDGNNYNALTSLIDPLHHYNILYNKKLISKWLRNKVCNWYLVGYFPIIFSTKYKNDKIYTNKIAMGIYKVSKYYKTFWLYILPVMISPRFLLTIPYLIGRTILIYKRKKTKTPIHFFKSSID